MATDPDGTPTAVPRTDAAVQRVLSERPELWELLFFAGLLLHGKDTLEEKWFDHEMQLPNRHGEHLNLNHSVTEIREAFDELSAIVERLTKVLQPEAELKAFGAPGEPGDPRRIENLASHVIRSYERLLDWAAELRGLRVPDVARRMIDLAASLADQPILEIRAFIDEVVSTVEGLPALMATNEPVKVELTLTVTVPDESVDGFSAALKALERVGTPSS